MGKPKDFYGKDVSDAINQACGIFSLPQEKLVIDVLETGSAGIFGLCKKKAHIRVSRKEESESQSSLDSDSPDVVAEQPVKTEKKRPPEKENAGKSLAVNTKNIGESKRQVKKTTVPDEAPLKPEQRLVKQEAVPPSEEVLGTIRDDIDNLLNLMGFSSNIDVKIEEDAVSCSISGAHEEEIIGPEGRTLDSMQYLIRKMMSKRLPERMPLYIDAGNFRERRLVELRQKALELAALVNGDGKTQAIPALNPSERRVVHMVLQEDKNVRSRSVGEGLFKKVLIYKPGNKTRKSGPRKRKSQQGGDAANQ